MMQLLSIQVGKPQTLGSAEAIDPMDREWRSGFVKLGVQGPVEVSFTNLNGDGQADLTVHGGPDKAINVYASEHYPYWRQELGLRDLPHGAFGENFTVSGLLETQACIGDIFESAGAQSIQVQISQPRQPCWKLARRWKIKDLAARVDRTGLTGWYFRVLREGIIEAGQTFTLVDRPFPEWTIAKANEIMNHRRDDLEGAARLAACPALSASWVESLRRRAQA